MAGWKALSYSVPSRFGDGDPICWHVHECGTCYEPYRCLEALPCDRKRCWKCQGVHDRCAWREIKLRGKRYWLGGALAALMLVSTSVRPAVAAERRAPDALTTALFVAAEAALVIDLGQTIDRGAGRAGPERNPLLGDRPGRAVAWGYFGGLMAAEAATYLWAPRWVSRTVSVVTLGLEIPTVQRNFQVGVRVRF